MENVTAEEATESWSASELSAPPSPSRLVYFCNMYRMLVFGFAIGTVCILGLIGNFMSCYTLWPTMRKEPTSLLIISLAVFDSVFMVVIFFNMSVTWVSKFFAPRNAWLLWAQPYSWCYFHPIGRLGHYAATWTIMLITFHRYVAVCHPTKMKTWCGIRQTRLQLAAIVLFFTLFSIPRAIYSRVELAPDASRALVVKTGIGLQRFWYDTFYETILYFTVIYVIPFPSLFAMTLMLIRALRELGRKRKELAKTTGPSRQERDLTRTMIAVVIVYIACQTPNPIRRALLGLLPPKQTNCGHFYYFYHPVSTCILMVNSAVNFLLYYKYGKRFRLTFHSRVRNFLRLPPKVEPSMELSNTATSLTG